MILESLKNKLRKIRKKNDKQKCNRFLEDVAGVIHVGANVGQERRLYERYGLNVLWIEPIPEVYERLKENIKGFAGQTALRYLITDKEDEEYDFNVASNNGGSSSLLELHLHKELWPDIKYVKSIKLRSKTLESIVAENDVDLERYGALIMDTQGTELLVLKSAENILNRFKYIKSEVADFESYAGCCVLKDIEQYLMERRFIRHASYEFARRSEGGAYNDVVYKNQSY